MKRNEAGLCKTSVGRFIKDIDEATCKCIIRFSRYKNTRNSAIFKNTP